MLKSIFLLALFISLSTEAALLTRIGEAKLDQLPSELKVLVWNIHDGKDKLFSYDYQHLMDDKHLALIQEANLNTDVVSALRQTSLGYTHVTSFKSIVNKIKMGVAIGSRALALSSVGLVSRVRELKSLSRKSALLQTFKISGLKEALMVASVHGINFVPNQQFVWHMQQIAEAMLSHQGPIFMGGDFNTWNPARLRHLDRIMGELGLKRADFPAGRKRFPNIGTLLGYQTGGELDQVYTRDLKIKERNVLTEVTSSDHVPLELEISLKAK